MANPLIPHRAEQPNVLSGLIRKRAEIAGLIEHAQAQIERYTAELDHVEATIRIFNKEVDIGAIGSRPVPPRHAAYKGEVSRLVRHTLSQAPDPLTSRDLALVLMTERSLPLGDKELAVVMVKRVCACLITLRRKGRVRVAGIRGSLQTWEWVSL